MFNLYCGKHWQRIQYTKKVTVSVAQLQLFNGRLGLPKISGKLPQVKKLFQNGGKPYKFNKIINFRQSMSPPYCHSALLNAGLGLEKEKSFWLQTSKICIEP